MSRVQRTAESVLPVGENKELRRKVKRFLALLYRYDCVGKDAYYKKDDRFPRESYRMHIGRKYLWIDAPRLRFAVTDKGLLFWPKKYWSCSDNCFGHIDFFLDESRWGKTIKRVHTRVRRGMGMRYESAVIDYHNLVVGHPKKCICGRTANVQNTVVGPRCQYCRGSDVRHMNSVRQLGGMPTANGKPLPTNASYRQG